MLEPERNNPDVALVDLAEFIRDLAKLGQASDEKVNQLVESVRELSKRVDTVTNAS